MNTQIKQQNKNIIKDMQPLNQMTFINLCNDYCIEPYLVLDDLRESNKRWYSITYKELKTFLNERY